MPKVQPYEPQVRPSPLQIPAQRLDPRGAFGEALVEGASRFASSMERIQDEDDKAVVKDRINQYRERSRARMFGDDDAFLNRQGKAAYDSRNDARDELSKYRDELSKGLSGNQQRMFSPLSQEYLDRDFDNIAKHAQKSRISWLNSEDEAAIESAQNDHALYWNAGDGENIRQIRGLVNNIAQRNGWGPEQKELKLEAALTAAHQSAIDNILTDNPRGAEAYFLEHKGEISPKVWDDISKKIDTAKTNGMAQSIADEAVLLGSESEAREYIKNKLGDEPEARSIANRLVAEEFSFREKEEKSLRDDYYNEAYQALEDGSLEQWKINNPEKYNRLTVEQKNNLKKKPPVETDRQAYYEAISLIYAGDIASAEKIIFSGKLSNTDAKKLLDLITKPKTQTTIPSSYTSDANKAITALIGPQPPKSKIEQHRLWQVQSNSLRGWLLEEAEKWYEDNPNKKNMDEKSKNEILDRLNVEVLIQDKGWFSSLRKILAVGGAAMTPTGLDPKSAEYLKDVVNLTEVGIPDIPREEYEKIVEVLKETGLEQSPTNVLLMYKDKL